MDWLSVGKSIIGLGAPLLGGALGGPMGAAAGKVLADALGVNNTPEEVSEAVRNSPEAAIAIANAEAEWAKATGAFATAAAAQSAAINETARAEISAGDGWGHWRNLLGYVVVFTIAGLVVSVLKDLWSNDFNSVTATISLVSAITPIFLGLLALLGYVAQDSNKFKSVAITGEQPSKALDTLGAIVKAVVKR